MWKSQITAWEENIGYLLSLIASTGNGQVQIANSFQITIYTIFFEIATQNK